QDGGAAFLVVLGGRQLAELAQEMRHLVLQSPPYDGEEGVATAPQAEGALGRDDPGHLVHASVQVGAGDDLGDQADVAALGGGDAGAGVVQLERVLGRDVPVDDRHDHHGPEADVDLRSAELHVAG